MNFEKYQLDIVDVKFIDAVIAEMHTGIPNVLIASIVFDSGKSY